MRRFALILTTVGLLVGVAGCGDKEEIVTEAETEGIWIDVGPLDYHIQGSRQINPAIPPDDSYAKGLPQGVLPPEADETYFGVFLRIENTTGAPHRTAEEFEIVDTEGQVFRPLRLDPDSNPFAYDARVLQVGEFIPIPDSAQDTDSTQGALLLFKLPLEAYSNRPLEFRIKSPGGAPLEATIDLDV